MKARKAEKAREVESRVLALLAGDPVAVDLYIRAKAARIAWTQACQRFRRRVARLKPPAGATTAELETIVNALGATAGRRQEDPSDGTPEVSPHHSGERKS